MAIPEYIPTQWVNGTAPGINSVRLNHIENGIKVATDEINVLNTTIENLMPAGAVIMFTGATIPTGWALCDGSQGTPNLAGKFIRGGGTGDIGNTGGSDDAVAVDHGHTFTGNALAPHDHSVNFSYGGIFTADAGTWSLGLSSTTDTVTGTKSAGTPSGTISNSGVSGVGKNVPAYYTLAYIMKLA